MTYVPTRITEARARLREQGSEQSARFIQAFDESRRGLDRATRAGINRMETVVRELRDEITDRLTGLTGSPDDPFLVRIVPEIQQGVNTALSDFARLSNDAIQAQMLEAWGLGQVVTANALNRVGIPLTIPTLTPEVLTSLGATTENVLTELSARVGNRVMREVRMAATALQPSSMAIRRIQDILRPTALLDGKRRRIGLGFQAEAIVRTEVGRVYSNAQQLASEQITESIPDLRKRWVTTLGRRRGHREAEDTYAVGGSKGPIPVKQRFVVTEYSRSDFNRQGFWTGRDGAGAQRVFRGQPRARSGRPKKDRMLYPRDPAASAGQNVNCSCVVMDVVPELEGIGDRLFGRV